MIDFDAPETVWEQLYAILRERIETGVYPEQRIIPSITQLEQEFSVARGTVRKVRDKLADEGFLRPVSGRGTFVRPRNEWGAQVDE
ncbi:GntR family transcriptional regulator [Streptosporangium sp. NPDC051023]|uniref:GntR family transcriptional regulator n=1 Tax=Streptosporangium sp. NPDC051023 TaxID=3155410 RepID=UPI00344CDA2B